jgi:hypothetical protein
MRVRDIINSLSEEELYTLEKDLKDDLLSFKDRVRERITDIERKKGKVCVTCGSSLHEKEATLMLTFGEDKFKKRASFCEIDCLEYFLTKLKNSKIKEWGVKK